MINLIVMWNIVLELQVWNIYIQGAIKALFIVMWKLVTFYFIVTWKMQKLQILDYQYWCMEKILPMLQLMSRGLQDMLIQSEYLTIFLNNISWFNSYMIMCDIDYINQSLYYYILYILIFNFMFQIFIKYLKTYLAYYLVLIWN